MCTILGSIFIVRISLSFLNLSKRWLLYTIDSILYTINVISRSKTGNEISIVPNVVLKGTGDIFEIVFTFCTFQLHT